MAFPESGSTGSTNLNWTAATSAVTKVGASNGNSTASSSKSQQSFATSWSSSRWPWILKRRPCVSQTQPYQQSIPRYVYFCVKLGTSYRFCTIRTDSMKSDAEFFSELKATYLRARGVLRSWFSIWQYDHCEFLRVSQESTHELQSLTAKLMYVL